MYKECSSLKCAQDCTAQVIDLFELKNNVIFWSIVSKLKRSPKKIIGEALCKQQGKTIHHSGYNCSIINNKDFIFSYHIIIL